MVVWSKIIPLAALGVAFMFIANAFARPAAATSTAQALTEQVSTVGAAGQNIQLLGQGVGGGITGLFQPLWEVSNLVERFSSLASGSANVGPVSQDLGGYASMPSAPTYTTSSGTDSPAVSSSPSTTIHFGGGSNPKTLPTTLSAAAKSFYSNLGVKVTEN